MHISTINGKEILYKDEGIELNGFLIKYDEMTDVDNNSEFLSFNYQGNNFSIPHNPDECKIIQDIIFNQDLEKELFEDCDDDPVVKEFNNFFKDIPDATEKNEDIHEKTSVYDKELQESIERKQKEYEEEQKAYLKQQGEIKEQEKWINDQSRDNFIPVYEENEEEENNKVKSPRSKKKKNTLAVMIASILGAIGIGVLGAIFLMGA